MLAITIMFVVAWGPQSQAFDHASSCARSQRANRARALQDAPCDLTKHPYCNTPGNNYPWHAIRRFVKENQGLMRRMYGNERHISVLKAELENYIEQEEEDIAKATLKYTKKTQSRAIKDRPHFRPIQNSDKKQSNDTLKVKPIEYTNTTKLNATDTRNKTETINETVDNKAITYKTKLESIANIEINHLDPDVITLDAVIKESIETNSIYPKSGDAKIDADTKNKTDKITTSTENGNFTDTTTDSSEDSTTESSREAWKPNDSSTLPPTLLFSEKVKVDRIDNKLNEKKEEFHQKPHQHQESQRPSVIKLSGANACESREIIDAPFWANSTRGEVLVLLNMWPYEQFIHQEMCVHERKQMYCREGCRCEQQYRLHRLLAYDPRNECRGIFADWFRFPACCTCRCYDVPIEFRARSPRILRPQYDEDIKRVIYEDVARDWYAMSAFEDDDDEEDLF